MPPVLLSELDLVADGALNPSAAISASVEAQVTTVQFIVMDKPAHRERQASRQDRPSCRGRSFECRGAEIFFREPPQS
jgi:hypothetical protein